MKKEKLKNAVRYFYDIQRLRMQTTSRSAKKADIAQAHLDEKDKEFLSEQGKRLKDLEGNALKEVGRLLKGIPIYEDYLKHIRGIGPTLSGVIISEINIERCNTVSSLWAWCGLAVGKDGKAVKPKRGEKLNYNPWLKSKMLKVLGDCLMKVCSLDERGYHIKRWVDKDNVGAYKVIEVDESKKNGKTHCIRIPYQNIPYRKYCDNYKYRKKHEMKEVCMGCNGTGKVSRVERDTKVDIGTKKPRKEATCSNCEGTGGPAPWGKSDQHRYNSAVRYMVKMFLQDLWIFWRNQEGLEVRAPFAEERLGRPHHPNPSSDPNDRPPLPAL